MSAYAPKPDNEEERLKRLQYYRLLDTDMEQMFDDLTSLAAKIFNVPVCLLSLVDEHRQWFKSKHGLESSHTPRNISFCQHAILGDDVFEIPDASIDERVKDSPLVTGDPNIRFYAGMPLIDKDGYALGTLCAIDQIPRTFTKDQQEQLRLLASSAMTMIELRREKLNVENSAKAKDEFLSNMSHEIRTPLNAIIGFNELLAKTKMNNEQKMYVDTVQKSSQSLRVIVNDILDFEKLESGKVVLENIPISTFCMIEHILKLQAPLASEKGLELLYEIDENLPENILGDETRLTQILVNLMNNAIKFTHVGNVKLKIDVLREEENKAYIAFTILDTGIGIAGDKINRIFERFSQAESSTTRLFGGTGLGLSIVDKLVKLQGGELSVKSELGVGSEFLVTIPFDIPAGNPEKKCNQRDLEATKENMSVSKDLFLDTSILLVEDNSLNQFLAKTFFQRWGAEIDVASNGEEACGLIQNREYDVVLMDLQMPVMDGFTATSKIRHVLKSQVPIIACSAHSFAIDKEKCIEAGMNDYISKPYTEQELIQTTLKYCNHLGNSCSGLDLNAKETDDFHTILNQLGEEYGKSILNDLVTMFLNNIPSKCELFADAVKTKNQPKMLELMEFFSGSLAGLGFENGHMICKTLQGAIKEGHDPKIEEFSKKLLAYFQDAQQNLERFRMQLLNLN